MLKVTIICMYRGHDAEHFVAVVDGELTEEQKTAWRREYECDEHYQGDEEETNNMSFVVADLLSVRDVGHLLATGI